MRNLITVVLCLSVILPVAAQEKWRNLRFEVGVSSQRPNPNGGTVKNSFGLYGELRYNLENIPIDLGFHFGYGKLERTRDDITASSDLPYRNFLLIGNYNFRQNENISFYTGIGIGYSLHPVPGYIKGWSQGSKNTGSFCVMPRAGMEFFRTVRLSTSYKIMNKDYSYWDLSLGIKFGGWKRK